MNSIGLFDFPVGMPLAARVRPENISQVYGQNHIKVESSSLTPFLTHQSSLPSLVLYGPPGVGKTTIARILARESGRRLIEISAINASISDLRAAFENSEQTIQGGGEAAIVFIDEIHRFSKVQQESVLKAVEEGLIVLIGATTENPLFSLTSALNSRCLLVSLHPLTIEDLGFILRNAITDERGLNSKFSAPDEVLDAICRLSGGDARKALTVLEAGSVAAHSQKRTEITLADIEGSIGVALARYDANGDQHYDIISAFIKSVRGSDPDAALHYLARMLVGGEDPRFIGRRLVILASEDIGLADPQALVIANTVMQVVAQIGMPEGRIPLAEAAIYLSLAPKSNSAYNAINKAIADVESGFTPEIPSYLRSTPAEKSAEPYVYPHDQASLLSSQRYLHDEREYYLAKAFGFEEVLAQRLANIKKLRKSE